MPCALYPGSEDNISIILLVFNHGGVEPTWFEGDDGDMGSDDGGMGSDGELSMASKPSEAGAS